MTPKISLIFIFMALVACGKSGTSPDPSGPPCGGLAALGTWTDPNTSDVLVLDSTCHGSDSMCSYELTFTPPNGAETIVNVTKSNGKVGCLAVGIYQCFSKVTFNDSRFNINCPNLSIFYWRL